MRAVVFAVFIAPCALLAGVAKSQTEGSTHCGSIQNQQSRAACFAQAGVPVIDCATPRDADEAAFCRNLRNKETTAPLIIHPTNDGPSFDCAKAKTAAARFICADGELARLDGELGVAYQKRKAQIPTADQLRFAAEQIAWIKERDARCDLAGRNSTATEVLASAKPCMMSMIRDRITFLSQAETTASGKSHSVAITCQSKATITAFIAANDAINKSPISSTGGE
jgi:uncharacterized protein YecT (DUF1311 family)